MGDNEGVGLMEKITILFVIALIIASIWIAFLSVEVPVGHPVNGKIVSINSWTGGDLTQYYNVTAVYNGGTFTQVITCDYYQINSTIPISTSLSGNILGINSKFLENGC